MSKQGWVETLAVIPFAGPSVNTVAVATSLFGNSTVSTQASGSKYVLPANYFDVPGKSLRITARGTLSSNTTGAPGTVFLSLVVGGIQVANFAAITMTTALNNTTWEWDTITTCRTIGANGSQANAQLITLGTFTGAVNTATVAVSLIPASGVAQSTGFDSTLTNSVDLQVTFSNGIANNQATMHIFLLESLN